MEKLIIMPVHSKHAILKLMSLACEIWGEFYIEAKLKECLKDGYYFIVQNIRKETIGYFGLSLSSSKNLWLDVIAVRAVYRRKRYGTRMLKVVEFLAKQMGHSFFMTTVHPINTEAVKFLKHSGFVEVDVGSEIIKMLKFISNSREKLLKVLNESEDEND